MLIFNSAFLLLFMSEEESLPLLEIPLALFPLPPRAEEEEDRSSDSIIFRLFFRSFSGWLGAAMADCRIEREDEDDDEELNELVASKEDPLPRRFLADTE